MSLNSCLRATETSRYPLLLALEHSWSWSQFLDSPEMNMNCPSCVCTCDSSGTWTTCNFMDSVLSVRSCTVTKSEKSDNVCNIFVTSHYKVSCRQYSNVLSVAESNTRNPTPTSLNFKYTGQAEDWDIIYSQDLSVSSFLLLLLFLNRLI